MKGQDNLESTITTPTLATIAASVMNRRRLLFGLAAASTAAAIPNATALTRVEDAELLRLGDMLPGLLSEYQAANDARWVAVDHANAQWPRAPEILYGGGGDIERNVEGAGINPVIHPRSGRTSHPTLWDAKGAASRIEMHTKSLRRCRAAKSIAWNRESIEYLTPIYEAATAYEARRKRARDRSGYEAAHARLIAAEKALVAHIFATLEIEPATMAGVVVQAQAVAASSKVNVGTMVVEELNSARNRGQMLAASLLRIAEGGAA